MTAQATEIELRPATADDETFLYTLYADRRAPELALTGWGPDEARAFVDMQFRAQQGGYGESFPDADHWIVLRDGGPVGRLLVDRGTPSDLVVDIVIHSRHRGLGIGTVLMREVMGDAAALGRGVSLTVDVFDERVAAWYQRLGFVAGEQQGPYLSMGWRPDPTEGP